MRPTMNLHPFEREYNEGLSKMGRGEGQVYWFCIGSNNPYKALGVPPNHVGPHLTELAIERPLGGSHLAKNGVRGVCPAPPPARPTSSKRTSGPRYPNPTFLRVARYPPEGNWIQLPRIGP